jgi:putative transposase
MKGKRFSEEQIIAVLKESEAGAKTKDVCRRHGISEATLYNWKARYAGMTVSEARRLRELEAENSKLKRLLADAELDKAALKDLLGRNGEPAGEAGSGEGADDRAPLRRDARVRAGGDLSVAVSLRASADRGRSEAAHRSDRGGQAPLRLSARVRVPEARRLAGQPQARVPAQRALGLAVRRRKRKRIGPIERRPLPKPSVANQSWSMDFVSDGLADGRRLRCLTVVDDCTRECLAIEVDTSITGTRVKAVMERLADTRGLPRSITVDHGPEFEGQVLDAWAYAAGVQLAFIRPGKPNENACIESFNGKFRDECLNEH